MTKRGTATSVTSSESGGETVVTQVITQTYMASQPGVYRLSPFTIMVGGTTASSEGATLLVRPPSTGPFGGTATTASLKIPTESGASFLSLRASKSSVYVREGFAMRLSLFVSDTYPFELRFDGVDAQLQAVLKQLRPTNAWEENTGIRALKGIPVVVNERKFTEYVIYQGVFFPLSSGTIQIPSVSLTLTRVRQVEPTTKPSNQSAAAEATEPITFQTSPISIGVRSLPPHPLQGQAVVGTLRLVERIDRAALSTGKSARYSIRIEGEGNIASLQAPVWGAVASTTSLVSAMPATDSGIEILPAGTNQQIDRTGEQIIGSKTFSYFLIPRRAGSLSLGNLFGILYFDPQTARYDTLTSTISLQVADGGTPGAVRVALEGQANNDDALYAGLHEADSTEQPFNLTVLVRAVANVVLVLMILGMIFVFFRK